MTSHGGTSARRFSPAKVIPSPLSIEPPLVAGRLVVSPGPLDTLIVADGWGSREAACCAETLDFIRTAGLQARRLASVCTLALILSAAGLLDGRRATTHWARAGELARAFPQIRVEPDR